MPATKAAQSPTASSYQAVTGRQPSDSLRDTVRRRSISLHAKWRLTDAIRAVALDIVGDPDTLPPAERAWLTQALASPVNEAAEEALRVLVQELIPTLASAPARVRPAIVAAPGIRRTDFE